MKRTNDVMAALSKSNLTTRPVTAGLAAVPLPAPHLEPVPEIRQRLRPDQKSLFARVPGALKEQIDELSFRSKRPVSHLVEESLRDLLEKYRITPPRR